jgi:CYTH domain-containing protein
LIAQGFAAVDWTEITGQSQYYNSSLVQHPFRAWARPEGASAIERRA